MKYEVEEMKDQDRSPRMRSLLTVQRCRIVEREEDMNMLLCEIGEIAHRAILSTSLQLYTAKHLRHSTRPCHLARLSTNLQFYTAK